MHILGILGSARTKGNTSAMLNSVLQRLESNGHTVDRLNLHECDLRFCTGCMACRATRRCVLDDDWQDVLERIQKADVIVLAAPAYWANVPAVVKNLFDRFSGPAYSPRKTGPRSR